MFKRLFQVVRRGVYGFLRLGPVNAFGRIALSKIHSERIYKGRYVFPVRGELRIRYPESHDFFMCSDGSDAIASRLYFGGVHGYEGSTSRVLTRFFEQGGIFFDIGANSGIYSLMAATFPQTIEVHAFEPMVTALNILQNNVRKNQFSKVRVNKLAIGDHEGTLELAVPRGIVLPTGSSAAGSGKFEDSSELFSEKVLLTTLDFYIERNGIKACDLIKIDTETTEPAVLRGASKTIARFRPKIVCEIIRESAAREIESLCKDFGYDYYHLTEQGPVQVTHLRPDLVNMNFLFLPANTPRRIEVTSPAAARTDIDTRCPGWLSSPQ